MKKGVQKLVKTEGAKTQAENIEQKNAVICDFYRKLRRFSDYFKNLTATQGHSHSMVPVGLGVRS